MTTAYLWGEQSEWEDGLFRTSENEIQQSQWAKQYTWESELAGRSRERERGGGEFAGRRLYKEVANGEKGRKIGRDPGIFYQKNKKAKHKESEKKKRHRSLRGGREERGGGEEFSGKGTLYPGCQSIGRVQRELS